MLKSKRGVALVEMIVAIVIIAIIAVVGAHSMEYTMRNLIQSEKFVQATEFSMLTKDFLSALSFDDGRLDPANSPYSFSDLAMEDSDLKVKLTNFLADNNGIFTYTVSENNWDASIPEGGRYKEMDTTISWNNGISRSISLICVVGKYR